MSVPLSGWLKKLSPSRFSRWQLRWFAVADGMLRYYKSDVVARNNANVRHNIFYYNSLFLFKNDYIVILFRTQLVPLQWTRSLGRRSQKSRWIQSVRFSCSLSRQGRGKTERIEFEPSHLTPSRVNAWMNGSKVIFGVVIYFIIITVWLNTLQSNMPLLND